MAVQPARDDRRGADALARQAERIEAELVAVDDQRSGAARDVVGRRAGSQLAESIEQAHARQCLTRRPAIRCAYGANAMTESFVDLTYRGLALGRRVKLTQVRPTTGYLEVSAPMPVGTAIAIATDEGIVLDATVVEIHEQVGGLDRAPGMVVQPTFATGKSWWAERVSLPELTKAEPPRPIVRPKRRSADHAVPELVDDGHNTAVMDAVDPGGSLDTIVADDPSLRDTNPNINIVDDGKRTIMMEAVDLAALGLDPASSSGSIPVQSDDDGDSDKNGNGTDSKSGARKKRKRR